MNRKTILGLLLVLASLISLALVTIRMLYNDDRGYSFLIWNLILAWVPYAAAWAASLAARNRTTFLIIMPFCTLVWLAFFPNAPYLLTDFQHLATANRVTPLWYDVILLLWAAWTGLLLGIASLQMMQEIIRRAFGSTAGWSFAIGVTLLSSIGVYLGRFLRWNSWNLLQDPLPIAKDMYGIVRHPLANLPTYVFLILFTLLFLFIYITIHLLGHGKPEDGHV
jgi:uncharacterized membrane protein